MPDTTAVPAMSRGYFAASAKETALFAAFVVVVLGIQGFFRVAAFIEKPFGPRHPHDTEIY